jgi:soluble methane monooxygenase-binding protein MmoD
MTRFRLLDDENDGVDGPAGPAATPFLDAPVIEEREIHNSGRYRAVIENLDFMWRWRIFRDGKMCQEGCSLSDASSIEAVSHVLAFYEIRDSGQGVTETN